MSLPVGADIESICSKCGDVWHVVVAKVGSQVAKVQCKQCGGYHRYRGPAGAQTSRRSASPAVTRRDAQPHPPPGRGFQPLVEPDLSVPARPYRLNDVYEPRQRIDHPKFGVGVVESLPGPGKVEVCFPAGRRVLAQARAASSLTRPPVRFAEPTADADTDADGDGAATFASPGTRRGT
jgi:hypothetical protein